MNLDLYIHLLKSFEEKGDEESIYNLFRSLMYDLSSMGAEDFTQGHLDIAKKGQLFFADNDDYVKAMALQKAIAYVEKVQETRRKIDEELEKLNKLKKDYGKEDDQ